MRLSASTAVLFKMTRRARSPVKPIELHNSARSNPPTSLSAHDQRTPERRSGRSGEIEKEIARKVTLRARRRKRDDRLADHIGPSGNRKCCGHICSGRNTAGYALTPCQGAG